MGGCCRGMAVGTHLQTYFVQAGALIFFIVLPTPVCNGCRTAHQQRLDKCRQIAAGETHCSLLPLAGLLSSRRARW